MFMFSHGRKIWTSAGVLAAVSGCSGAPEQAAPSGVLDGAEQSVTSTRISPQTRLERCSQDPRVMAGLVGPEVCAGADIFFNETFGGNGRTCGSCHPVANNLTIDVPFIEQLHAQKPQDPLFVAEFNPDLAQLETVDLVAAGGILENVDGFGDPANKFVSRAVNHLFSLRTSILRDPGDGTSGAVIERTGWAGDGAPGDGTLRMFLDGAIEQHFTKTLARQVNVDFQLPDQLERDLTAAFQLSLGRMNELDLASVRISDAQGEQGRVLFLDPQRAGRCNLCHANAGANFIDTRLNRNFDTFTRFESTDAGLPPLHGGTVNGEFFSDGGFDAVTPTPTIPGTVDGEGNPVFTMNALGNGTFNVPPLIEAADTGPFFHNNIRGPQIENAVNFYGGLFFGISPAVAALDQRFGPPLETLNADQAIMIARFLRILNAAFNASLTIQRLEAVQTLIRQFQNGHVPIQQKLVELAIVEIDDALQVLQNAPITPIQTDVQTELTAAKGQAQLAISAATDTVRNQRVSNALTRMRTGRSRLGTNITFQMGQGNLMF
jgi:cytochrome c peroxidase